MTVCTYSTLHSPLRQHFTTFYNIPLRRFLCLQRFTTFYNVLQRFTTFYNVLQRFTTFPYVDFFVVGRKLKVGHALNFSV